MIAYNTGVFDRLEYLTIDQRFKARGTQFSHPKIVLIEIAEDSIENVGRWPWDRGWHATAVKALKDFGAKEVAFDVLFSEPADEETDTLFSKMILSSENVYLPVAFGDIKDGEGVDILKAIPILSRNAVNEGHITIIPDRDGIIRRIKPKVTYKGYDYWQLGFIMGLNYLGVKLDSIKYSPRFVEFSLPSNPSVKIPLTDEGDLILNWVGLWKESFQHVSFIDTIVSYTQWLKGESPRIDPKIFKDALCIIGVSATGLFDIRATPVEPAYPAMGVNATVLNTVIERSFLRPASHLTNILILWLVISMIFIIMMRTNYVQTMLSIIVLTFVYIAIAFILFIFLGIIITIIYPIFLITTSYIALTAYHQIVISIEKNRLMKLATTDPLTGLYNVGHFKRLLQAELQSTQLRTKKDICLVMIDGDHFKKVNDSYGHPAGDAVLRGFGEILRANCRALDVAARYGGEEFIIMLPGANIEAAIKVADKIRNDIEQRRFLGEFGAPNHIQTASFGVANYQTPEDMDSTLSRVDKALYLAKESGRNRVCTL